MWPLAAVVLLGHGLALNLLASLPPAPPPAGDGGEGAIFQVRAVVSPAVALERTPAPPAPLAAAAPPAVAMAPASTGVTPASPTMPSTAAQASGDLPYLPRGELTQPPRPMRPVDVPFPDVGGVVDLKVHVTVFVDEQGVAQRVRIDTPGVAPVFEQAIRETFRRAPFAPGTVQGAAVRSQLPIEVEFKGEAPRRR